MLFLYCDQKNCHIKSAAGLLYYKQTNVNLYLEFLGKSNPGKAENLMDLAPAVQFIFNSKLRVDLSQRIQLWGNMDRSTKNMYLIRAEYNLFNVF
ncbi:MAG TPA: hypothetical protein DIT07_08915 [Sphingobacteriaceae bacterium]|nr:hypothetical protein [Sphingobacteriaceae bacterium]